MDLLDIAFCSIRTYYAIIYSIISYNEKVFSKGLRIVDWRKNLIKHYGRKIIETCGVAR